MIQQENSAFLLQKKLFELIKLKLPIKENLARSVAEVLHVGADAAYKRISSERLLDLSELMRLMHHYELQWGDLALPFAPDQLYMQQRNFGSNRNSLLLYLQGLSKTLQQIDQGLCGDLIFTLKELSILQLAALPALCQFYLFLLQKHVLNLPEFKHRKFSLDQPDTALQDQCMELYQQYLALPATELWVAQTPMYLGQQLAYYKAAHLFEEESCFEFLKDCYTRLLQHLEFETFEARKYHLHTLEAKAVCKRYYHELISGEQAICAQLKEGESVWLQNDCLQVLYSRDQKFTKPYLSNVQGLCHKAIYLNGQNEKWLTGFFYGVIQGMGRVY